jgi:hypothetical protein
MNPTYIANYSVFRNVVKDFGADNTGKNDSSFAIQAAIDGKLYCLIICFPLALNANIRRDSWRF